MRQAVGRSGRAPGTCSPGGVDDRHVGVVRVSPGMTTLDRMSPVAAQPERGRAAEPVQRPPWPSRSTRRRACRLLGALEPECTSDPPALGAWQARLRGSSRTAPSMLARAPAPNAPRALARRARPSSPLRPVPGIVDEHIDPARSTPTPASPAPRCGGDFGHIVADKQRPVADLLGYLLGVEPRGGDQVEHHIGALRAKPRAMCRPRSAMLRDDDGSGDAVPDPCSTPLRSTACAHCAHVSAAKEGRAEDWPCQGHDRGPRRRGPRRGERFGVSCAFAAGRRANPGAGLPQRPAPPTPGLAVPNWPRWPGQRRYPDPAGAGPRPQPLVPGVRRRRACAVLDQRSTGTLAAGLPRLGHRARGFSRPPRRCADRAGMLDGSRRPRRMRNRLAGRCRRFFTTGYDGLARPARPAERRSAEPGQVRNKTN